MDNLRDALAEQIETLEPIQQPEPVVQASEPVVGETPEQAEQRARDEKGRFAASDKLKSPAINKTTPPGTSLPGSSKGAAAAEPVKRPPRPSSWKKEYWEAYDALDPKLAEYINQREAEYSHGVSAYKTEAEQAKDLRDAVAPFLPELQQHSIHPTTWIRNLGIAHKTLVFGNPQQKLGLFAQMARDYNVPLQALMDPNVANQYLYQQQQAPAPDVRSLVREQLEEERSSLEVQSFMADAATKYPHFESVKQTMVGLLRQELATDLDSAYQAAVRMNPELHEAEQARIIADKQAEDLRKKAEIAQRARTHNVSLKSATPSRGNGAGKSTDLRSTLLDSFDAAEDRV
jgi:hypothetical protein